MPPCLRSPSDAAFTDCRREKKRLPVLTLVIAGAHHPAEMLRPTVLRDDAEAQQVAVTTRDVQRRVAVAVHQRGVAAGHQQVQTHVGLVRYHSQVERSLGGEENRCLLLHTGENNNRKETAEPSARHPPVFGRFVG